MILLKVMDTLKGFLIKITNSRKKHRGDFPLCFCIKKPPMAILLKKPRR